MPSGGSSSTGSASCVDGAAMSVCAVAASDWALLFCCVVEVSGMLEELEELLI